jgi:4-alpha-glucanotransferase
LFTELKYRFSGPPIIAEDLGVITPDVKELGIDLVLPGMKILQFAFSGDPEDTSCRTTIPLIVLHTLALTTTKCPGVV